MIRAAREPDDRRRRPGRVGDAVRYHARWILPITAAPIPNGTLIEEQGRIAWIGPRAEAPPAGEGEREWDLGAAILLPGLVNVHAHLDLSVMRGFLEDLPFGTWIRTLTKAKKAVLDRDVLLDAARLSLVEGLRSGVTTVAETSDTGVALEAMRELRVRGISYQEVFGPDPATCDEKMQELGEAVVDLRRYETERVRAGISPHAPYSVCDALFTAAARFAIEEKLPMAIHIAESADEMRYVSRGEGDFADSQRDRGFVLAPRGRTPIEMLERTGALEANPLLIHCVRVDDADIATIARHDCAVAHCPAANAKLGHGIAPLREILDAGIHVGLGSDSVASNNRMDILAEARLAALFQRVRLGSPDCLTAGQALTLATMGGARALGLDHEIGSLEVGKSADFAVFSLGVPNAIPTTDPVTTAVFSLAGGDASLVAIEGEPLVMNGSVAGDSPELRTRVQAAADRLAEWRRHSPS
jgi:5-methylthioadenosine/S-adenosylhomocysteine deaminase